MNGKFWTKKELETLRDVLWKMKNKSIYFTINYLQINYFSQRSWESIRQKIKQIQGKKSKTHPKGRTLKLPKP
jgi:hypothetical protein